jgi:hypothetical protein
MKFNRHQSEHIELKRRLRTAQQHERDSLLIVQAENGIAWRKSCPNQFEYKAQLREAQFFGIEKESMDQRDHEEVLIDIEALHAAGRGETPDREIIRQRLRKGGK